MASAVPTRRSILKLAWPVIIANTAVPLLGLTDTAVLGNVGDTAALGAIALGSLAFSFVYWCFGFLRMSTTGFTAQAAGAGDEPEVRAILGRAWLFGVSIGVLLIAAQWPLGKLLFWAFDASPAVERLAAGYFFIRIWGAPATLGTYALMGSLIGLGQTRPLLGIQLLLNGLNIVLDLCFAGWFAWGAEGIAWGTVIAEWTTFLIATGMVFRLLRDRRHDDAPFWSRERLQDRGKLAQTLSANADIMVRTLMLLLGFAWFTNQSARFGDTALAANHVLLQFLSFSAFFLDGYAFVAESLVGEAIGAGHHDRFRLAIRRSTELSFATGLLLALGALVAGKGIIFALTDLEAVRDEAMAQLPWAASYMLLGFAAFQLDGIFIGATWTRAMRNASLESFLLFLVCWWPLTHWLHNRGLWWAFNLYVVARAVTLATRLPALARQLSVTNSKA